MRIKRLLTLAIVCLGANMTWAQSSQIKSMDMPANVSASTVVSDYISAIGGLQKVNAVDYLVTRRVANSPLGELEVYEVNSKNMDKVESLSMGGNVINKKVVQGDKGFIVSNGNQIDLHPVEVSIAKMGAVPFAELTYFDRDIFTFIELSGVEVINEEEVYRLDMVRKDGLKMSAFYGVNTGLKVRSVNESAGQLVTTDYDSYKETEGILFPTLLTVSGSIPMPLELVTKTIEVNPSNPEALFK